jgi:Transglycosylase-like domain
VKNPFVRLLVLAGALSIALGAATQTEPHAATSTAARLAQLDAIADHRKETWRWQALMSKPRTPTLFMERRSKDSEYLKWLGELWQRRADKAQRAAQNPPHRRQWLCIHRYERHPEQGWATRTGNGYYGGLQMDISFQRTYGGELLRRKGTANRWTAAEQMWVAERAYRSGRGFYPWPNTARHCGLI